MLSPMIEPRSYFDGASGKLHGEDVLVSTKVLGQLAGVFADAEAFAAMDPSTVVYHVEMQQRTEEGTAGGLFFGTSFLRPGKVGNEYNMTRGHFHSRRECAEYYWCIRGTGALIMMNEARETWAEILEPGSLHYIPGQAAHRLVNTGDAELAVGACWPSDAGHDYDSINTAGFSARLLEINGNPTLIADSER